MKRIVFKGWKITSFALKKEDSRRFLDIFIIAIIAVPD